MLKNNVATVPLLDKITFEVVAVYRELPIPHHDVQAGMEVPGEL